MNDKEWAKRIAEKIKEKVTITANRAGSKIPYTTRDGIFDDWSGERIGWWTNGFFAGQLWLLYWAYRKEEWRKMAEDIEEKLDKVLMDYLPMDHDAGFRFLLSAVANYRITGKQSSRNRAILAASNLAGRFNLAGNFIRAWNDTGTGDTAGLAIIDCMMNLPLLYFASNELNDPRFYHIAVAHADMVQREFIRKDGSVHHIVAFDPKTGNVIGPQEGQGMQVGSAWTRGQAWALYGFTLSYLHTKEKRYLDTAKQVADYIISKIPTSGLIPVDFDQPANILWEDSTASAIISCGLLELEKFMGEKEKEQYHKIALFLLKTLEEKRCNWTLDIDHIVENCTAAYHDENHNFAIIYGDYFFTEAILKLAGNDILLW